MRKRLFHALVFLIFMSPIFVSGGVNEVRKGLQQLNPDMPIGSIKKSVIAGLYEVIIGTDVYYVSSDGQYIVSGNIFESKTQKNLTEIAQGEIYLNMVNKAGESGMIIYEPKRKVRHTLTVFTDVDCPYCRKFHKEVSAHLEQGIRIRYVMFPLRGLQTPTYKKEVSVWCSEDRIRAMDMAKSGQSIKEKDCPNPVAHNLALARAMGITGTPTLMTEEGILLRGYVPKDELHARLGLEAGQRARK